jgi:iron complex outermembrane receptor protein
MQTLSPLTRRPETLSLRRRAALLSSCSILALAITGSVHAQTQPLQNTTPPAAEAQAPAEVKISPIDVSAAKARKPKKKQIATTLAAVPRPAEQLLPTPFAADQGRTPLGHLTVATPIAGTAVQREQLEDVRPADMQRELLPQIPGVSMVRNMRIPIGGKAYTNDLMDGYAMKSATLGNVGFLDEVNTADIETIEVTRGPGSVLYSSKAIGGTINVITRDPPLTPEAGVWGDVGSYGLQRLGARAADSSEDGVVGVSINASSLQDEGWRDRSARENQSVSGKVVLKPDADTKITFRSEYVDWYKEYPGTLTQAQFDENWRQAALKNLYEDYSYQTTMLDVKRRIGTGGELTLAWVNHKQWGTNACPAGCSSPAASTSQVETDYDDTNLRAVYRQDFDFLKSRAYIGVDAFLSEKSDDTYGRKKDTFTRLALSKSFFIEETTVAPFAQYEFSPVERLRFTLGVRQENYALDADDLMATNKDGSKEYDQLVRKGGVTYEYINNHYIWGGIAEGFYVPGTSETVSGFNAHDLPPETSLTYSAGLRGALVKQRLSYDVGYYNTTIDNLSFSALCPWYGSPSPECPEAYSSPRDTYPASGKVRFEGIESALSWQPFDLLKFGVSHTYALNTFVEYKDRTSNYAGNKYYYSPDHHLNGRVTLYPAERLKVQFEADYISPYFTDMANTDSYQRPVIYNMRVGYKLDGKTELWAHAYNLFDTKYAERAGLDSTGARNYSEGYHPLTVRAGLSFNW